MGSAESRWGQCSDLVQVFSQIPRDLQAQLRWLNHILSCPGGPRHRRSSGRHWASRVPMPRRRARPRRPKAPRRPRLQSWRCAEQARLEWRPPRRWQRPRAWPRRPCRLWHELRPPVLRGALQASWGSLGQHSRHSQQAPGSVNAGAAHRPSWPKLSGLSLRRPVPRHSQPCMTWSGVPRQPRHRCCRRWPPQWRPQCTEAHPGACGPPGPCVQLRKPLCRAQLGVL